MNVHIENGVLKFRRRFADEVANVYGCAILLQKNYRNFVPTHVAPFMDHVGAKAIQTHHAKCAFRDFLFDLLQLASTTSERGGCQPHIVLLVKYDPNQGRQERIRLLGSRVGEEKVGPSRGGGFRHISCHDWVESSGLVTVLSFSLESLH